jgi:hypothetical protein
VTRTIVNLLWHHQLTGLPAQWDGQSALLGSTRDEGNPHRHPDQGTRSHLGRRYSGFSPKRRAKICRSSTASAVPERLKRCLTIYRFGLYRIQGLNYRPPKWWNGKKQPQTPGNKKPIFPTNSRSRPIVGCDRAVRVHLPPLFCPIISALAKLKAPHRGDHGKALEYEYFNLRPL